MFYATHKLHLPQGDVLSMHVVEIVGGVVQGWFPFDGERQSMLWEDELYLSCNLRELIHIANERLCTRAQWEIRDLVKQMVALVDPALHFMLVPKCQSGRIICNSPCGRMKNE